MVISTVIFEVRQTGLIKNVCKDNYKYFFKKFKWWFHCFHFGHLLQLIIVCLFLLCIPLSLSFSLLVFALLAPQINYTQVFSLMLLPNGSKSKYPLLIKRKRKKMDVRVTIHLNLKKNLLCILVILCFLFLFKSKIIVNKSAFPKAGSCSLCNS